MFRNIAKMGLATTGIFAASYAMAKDQQRQMDEFQQKYPGEEPITKTHTIGSIGWYTTLERKEDNPESTTPSPK
jgi:hypothetical protein